MLKHPYPSGIPQDELTMQRGPSPPNSDHSSDHHITIGTWQKRYKATKSTCYDMKYFFAQRAALEEEFALKLRNLANLPLGNNEGGNVQLCLSAVKKDLETTATAHEQLASKIRNDLETPTRNQLDQLSTNQRNIKSNLLMKQQTHSNHLFMLERTKERYHETNQMEERQFIDHQLHKLGQQFEHGSREWEEELNRAMEGYRQLEISRVQFVRNALWKYTNLLSGVCVTDDEGQERIRNALEKCDAKAEVDNLPKHPVLNNSNLTTPHLDEKHPNYTVVTRGSPLRNEIRKPIDHHRFNHLPVESQNINKLMSSELLNATIARSPILAAQRSLSSGGRLPERSASTNSSPATNPLARNMSIAYLPRNTPSRMNPISPSKDHPYQRPSPSLHPPYQTTPPLHNRPTHPPPVPTTTHHHHHLPPVDSNDRPVLFHVKAVYDYDAEIPEEISLREGQTIAVLATQLDGWWEGQTNDGHSIRQGIFPSNFTEPVSV